MAAINSTTNDASYVAGNQLADAAMLIRSAMRLIEQVDGEAFCLLEKASIEIISAQDFLEGMDSRKSPISKDVAAMQGRIGMAH